MQISIPKICADYLRTSLSENHNIKLKSGHAHEIVAAVFGYKSNIALKQDDKCSLANLNEAHAIVLEPPILIIEHRLATLKGLPPDLPPSHTLAELVYSALKAKKEIANRIQNSLEEYAVALARYYPEQHLKSLGYKNPQGTIEVDKQISGDEIIYNVYTQYAKTRSKEQSDVGIRFLRIAGNIGYKIIDNLSPPPKRSEQPNISDSLYDFDQKSGE